MSRGVSSGRTPIRAIRGASAALRIPTLTAIPIANAAGTADRPIVGDSVWPAMTMTTNPAIEASVGRIVLWVAYSARLRRWVRLSNGIEKANTARIVVVRAMSSSSNAPPPSRIRIAVPPNTNRTSAAPVVRIAITAKLIPNTRPKPRRSPDAAAVDMIGKAEIANAAPIRLTGTLWKLRAKLTELTEPGASVEASAVK